MFYASSWAQHDWKLFWQGFSQVHALPKLLRFGLSQSSFVYSTTKLISRTRSSLWSLVDASFYKLLYSDLSFPVHQRLMWNKSCHNERVGSVCPRSQNTFECVCKYTNFTFLFWRFHLSFGILMSKITPNQFATGKICYYEILVFWNYCTREVFHSFPVLHFFLVCCFWLITRKLQVEDNIDLKHQDMKVDIHKANQEKRKAVQWLER